MSEDSISQLVGKTLVEITDCKSGSEVVNFAAEDGSQFKMYHDQDCCEHVYLEDVCGEPDWLIGQPILSAEERTNQGEEPNAPKPGDDSHTWTFYVLSTNRGTVTLRWLGESNGYYSESVTFRKVA